MEKPSLAQIRADVPELEGLDDEQAVDFIQQVYMPSMDRGKVADLLGVKPVIPEESLLEGATRGFKDAMVQIPQTIGGAIALAGDAVGSEGMVEYGMGMYDKNSQIIADRARETDSLSNVLENGGEGTADFLAHGVGYVAGQAATAVATGGAGGFLGSQIAKRGLTKALPGALAGHAAKRELTEEAAGALAARATPMLTNQASRTGAKIGAGTALFGQNLQQEAGSIYPEAREEAEARGDVDDVDLGRVGMAAAGAAAVDTVMQKGLMDKVTTGARKQGESITRAMAREVPAGMAGEGVTEGIQTGIERWGATKALTTAEAIREYVDAAGMGMLGGGLAGAGASLHGSQPAAAPAGPLEALGRKTLEDQVLQLAYDPQPLVSFPDGSVGTKTDLYMYLQQFTDPAERQAKEREIMGRDPKTGKRLPTAQEQDAEAMEAKEKEQAAIEAKKKFEPDPDTAKRSFDAWTTRHDPVPLDFARKLLASPGAKGQSLFIVPHPGDKKTGAQGYTVIPSKFLTLDDQVKYGDLQQQPKTGAAAVAKKGIAPTNQGIAPIAAPASAPATDPKAFEQAAHEAATSPKNDLPEPTDAQKEAGNYKKGHVSLHGLDISIENPAGSTRKGVDKQGKPWENKLVHHYGYIKGTRGADKDHIDTFINGTGETEKVYIVNQVDPDTGKFDEHKVVFGAADAIEALDIYEANYAAGWQGAESIHETDAEGFKAWLKTGDTTKPYQPNSNTPNPAPDKGLANGQTVKGNTLSIDKPADVTPTDKGNKTASSDQNPIKKPEKSDPPPSVKTDTPIISRDMTGAAEEAPKRYQWMRNKEGGQKAGNRQEIRPVTADLFKKHVAPLVDKPELKDFDAYRAENPDVTHASFVSTDAGKTWRLEQVGSLDGITPKPEKAEWVKEVADFDSDEAKQQASTADSETGTPIISGDMAGVKSSNAKPEEKAPKKPENGEKREETGKIADSPIPADGTEAKPKKASKEELDHLFGVDKKKLAAILKKQIPGMTDEELQYAVKALQESDPENARLAKLEKALTKRGVSPLPPTAKTDERAGEALPNATAPEHVIGVDDRELGQIVAEFNDAQAEMIAGDHPVTNVFAAPERAEIVRLNDKAKVYHKEHGWMTVAEAKRQIEDWKNHARAQGEDKDARSANSQRVVLSLFDLSGEWSKPWEEAGYQVYRFDIQDDPEVGDVNNFSTEFFGDWFGDFEGMDIYAVLAACPCTDFASSGARHFAAKDADGRTVSSVKLVHQTLRTIEYFKPAVWALENPVGRIEDLGGLPPWRLSFDPNHLGDPYTKKTLIWGRFNGDLPVAPVEPTEGSKMHKLYGGKSLKTKNARSVTPEGFSYGFFMANNAIDHPAMAVANKFDRLERSLIQDAIKAGVTEQEITEAVEDFYYMDMDDDAANDAIEALIKAKTDAITPDTDLTKFDDVTILDAYDDTEDRAVKKHLTAELRKRGFKRQKDANDHLVWFAPDEVDSPNAKAAAELEKQDLEQKNAEKPPAPKATDKALAIGKKAGKARAKEIHHWSAKESGIASVTAAVMDALTGYVSFGDLEAVANDIVADLKATAKFPTGKPDRPETDSEGNTLPAGFWEKFGNSQAVDAQGRPIVVYHGTPYRDPITRFDATKAGSTTEADDAKEGLFFTTNRKLAEQYARLPQSENEPHTERITDYIGGLVDSGMSIEEARAVPGQIVRAYLKIPTIVENDFKGQQHDEKKYLGIIGAAKRQGSQGVVIRNTAESDADKAIVGDTYVVFEPEQVIMAGSEAMPPAAKPQPKQEAAALPEAGQSFTLAEDVPGEYLSAGVDYKAVDVTDEGVQVENMVSGGRVFVRLKDWQRSVAPVADLAPIEAPDTGADIPAAYFNKTKVEFDVWLTDEQQYETVKVPAAKALESIREDMDNLKQLLKCMRGG